MLVANTSAVNAYKLTSNVATYYTARGHYFVTGQSVVVAGLPAPFSATVTVVDTNSTLDASLAIYSKQLVESIKKQGIHSRKTFTIEKPNIDKNLMNHFIRGYFDGDGSFSFNPTKYIIKTQIVSASDEFKRFIIEELRNNNIKINLYSGIKLQIQNKMDNDRFYNYIYNNAKIYLKRKKEKYEEFRRHYGFNN